MRVEILQADEAATNAARIMWQRKSRSRKKFGLTFDELLECLKADMKIEEIAQLSGTVRQNVSHIYNTYFKDVFGGTGRHRHHLLSVARRRNLAKRQLESREYRALRSVVSMAVSRGLEVNVVECHSNNEPTGRIRGQMVRIGGRVCRIHYLGNTQQTNPRSRMVYTHATVSRTALRGSEFSIFLCRTPGNERRVFILPNRLLIRRFFKNRSVNITQFYLPTTKSKHGNGRKPKVNFWRYEDAWHLLRTN